MKKRDEKRKDSYLRSVNFPKHSVDLYLRRPVHPYPFYTNRYVIGRPKPQLPNYKTLFCHSILRLEPYFGQPHQCVYCYAARSRKSQESDRLKVMACGSFAKVFSMVSRRMMMSGSPRLCFRMSTRTDPFSELERLERISLKIMGECFDKQIPLILNTKGTLLKESPWLEICRKLAEKKLVVVQVTLTTPKDEVASLLEPNAPLSSERFEMIRILNRENIPTIIRFQPIIPYVNDSNVDVELLIRNAKDSGAKHIIAEHYRFIDWEELDGLKEVATISGEDPQRIFDKDLWELSPDRAFRPILSKRYADMERIRNLCIKQGLDFTVCREGFFDLNTIDDCCGTIPERISSFKRKPTFYDVWKLSKNLKCAVSYNDFLAYCDKNEGIISRQDLNRIPIRSLATGLRRYLDSFLGYWLKPIEVCKLTPCIKYRCEGSEVLYEAKGMSNDFPNLKMAKNSTR